MATIDSKKLLPAGKPGSSIVESQKPLLIPVNNVIFKKDVKISQKLLKPADEEKDSGGSLVVIRKKVLKISDVINSTYLIEQNENNRKRKERERQKSEEREKKLETRKPTKSDEKNLAKLSLPGGSILDTIKRFLGFTLLGYLFDKYNQFLPKLVEFTKLITPVAQFIETFAKNAVNSVINFIDLGYRAYDSVNKMIKDVGGEGAAKQFEQFSTEFNKLLNGAIAAAMLVASTAPRSPGGVAGGLGASASRGMGGAVPKPTSGFGAGTAMTPGRYRLPGQAKAGGSFNSQLARKGLTFEQSVAAQQASKQASKQVAKQSLKSLVAVPVIGALIGFIIDTVVFREKPSRAAAGAIGSAIGQGIGIALAGSTTFGLGAGIGMFVGGFAGDWLGKTIYDGLTGFKPAPTEARAQGGQVSGGQSRVSPTRRIRTTQARQRRSYVPQKTQPGKDVGGKQKIEQLYGKDEPGKRSALRALRKSSEDLKKMRSLNGVAGAMFGAGIDMSLGQKPDKKLAASLGNTFGSVIQAAVDAELDSSFNDISKTIAMANGGVVPSREIKGGMSIGEKIGKYISNAFSIALESSASKVLQNLNQEFNLEGGAPGGMDGGAGGGGGDGGGDGGGGGQFTGSAANIPPEGKSLLDAIAGSESGGYNSRYPSKTFDNNWVDHPRISERILSGPNKGKTSDAAGRYQFLSSTWDQYKPGKAFTPENQDIAAYRLAIAAYGYGESGLLKDLKSDPAKVARKLSGTWTSLPGGIEPNNATNGFLSRFEKSVKRYKEMGQPLSSKDVKKFSKSSITSFFGQKESFRKKPHEGMDIAAPQGTPISFGMGGEVIGVWRTNSGSRDANGGYGTYMDIKFSDGRIARIAHLSSIPASLKKGSKFKSNQIIAYSGGEEGKPGSGRSGGPHIHLEQLSKPMGIEETTKGKFDPLKGGIFDIIQQGGTKVSLAPSQQSKEIASLQQNPSYGLVENNTFVLQERLVYIS
jgi:muramidase (phage lysozyme)